jgi:nucleoid-associated protein YgaU
MAKNGQIKPKLKHSKIEQSPKEEQQKNNIWEIFKFGESYTSLVLGIIVVIVATITLITFVKGKDNITRLTEGTNSKVAINTQVTKSVTPSPSVTGKVPTNIQKKITVTPTTAVKKKTAMVKATVKPTAKPTQKVAAKPTAKATPKVAEKKVDTNKASGSTYIVIAGDTLWGIAEKKFQSGYNWVDIQKANKITEADKIAIGQKLTIPNVKPKVATVIRTDQASKVVAQTTTKQAQITKIETNNYTVVKGDTLWDIAERAYGDGYVWSKIASANKLINPSVIHAGNKLSIPRG